MFLGKFGSLSLVTGFALPSSSVVDGVTAEELSHLTVREHWLERGDLRLLRADQNLVWDCIQQVLKLLLLEPGILFRQVHACLGFLLDVKDDFEKEHGAQVQED